MTTDVLAPATEGPDYNVKITIRNGRLLRKLRELGYSTVASFCRATGMTQTTVQSIMNLEQSGKKPKDGEWRKAVIDLADVLGCAPEDIVPVQHWYDGLAKRTFEVEFTGDQAAALVGSHATPDDYLLHDDVQNAVGKMLDVLPPKERDVMRLLYGLDGGPERTLDEVSAELGLGVSRERIRQLEKQAMRTIKRRYMSKNDQSLMQSFIRDLAAQE